VLSGYLAATRPKVYACDRLCRGVKRDFVHSFIVINSTVQELRDFLISGARRSAGLQTQLTAGARLALKRTRRSIDETLRRIYHEAWPRGHVPAQQASLDVADEDSPRVLARLALRP
jgi:hypothetical protein